jgi:glycolate oxidase FAD binding subunit
MAHGAGSADIAAGACVMTAGVASAGTARAGDVRERVRQADSRKHGLRIVGGGSWLDANRPVQSVAQLEMAAHSGIVEYEPGDLTITVRAGTTLDDIARATEANGQWLTLDPYGDPTRATIGATIATASYGPLAHHFGTPRDIVLGVEFVTGAGDIVRGGGRVVKNVAGFDLTRLFTGSWGTIGALTEATLRLRALPAVHATLAIDVGSSEGNVEQMRLALRQLPFVPLAAQLIDGSYARSLSVSDRADILLVRLGGNEQAVAAQREQLRSVGEPRDLAASVWRRLQIADPVDATVLRVSRLPSAFAHTWRDARRLVERWPGAVCHGDPGRGVVRAVLPGRADTTDAGLRAALDLPFDGTRLYERLPAALWASLAPSAMHGAIDRGIKLAFDPHHILNPGIFGEPQ